MAFVTSDYATREPYIDDTHAIRCLAVGDQIWAMARRGVTWKATTRTKEYKIRVSGHLRTLHIKKWTAGRLLRE